MNMKLVAFLLLGFVAAALAGPRKGPRCTTDADCEGETGPFGQDLTCVFRNGDTRGRCQTEPCANNGECEGFQDYNGRPLECIRRDAADETGKCKPAPVSCSTDAQCAFLIDREGNTGNFECDIEDGEETGVCECERGGRSRGGRSSSEPTPCTNDNECADESSSEVYTCQEGFCAAPDAGNNGGNLPFVAAAATNGNGNGRRGRRRGNRN